MVSVEDAVAVVAGATTSEESVSIDAVRSYQRAMTYVLQAARDPYFEYSNGVLNVIHFITTEFDLDAHPGLIRPGDIFVVNAAMAHLNLVKIHPFKDGNVGGTGWAHDLDARDWVRYCLKAHHFQATILTRRIAEAEELWGILD